MNCDINSCRKDILIYLNSNYVIIEQQDTLSYIFLKCNQINPYCPFKITFSLQFRHGPIRLAEGHITITAAVI